jgi:hypothetical protein
MVPEIHSVMIIAMRCGFRLKRNKIINEQNRTIFVIHRINVLYFVNNISIIITREEHYAVYKTTQGYL